MPYFESQSGHPLYYRDIGRGDPLILLHGFGMQSAHWLPFALPLSRSHRIIMPDLRGFGRSHHADFFDECILSNYAHDLDQLVKHLRLGRFKLAGISMGALSSLQYQGLYGDSGVSHYMHIDQSPVCSNKEDWRWGLFGDEQALRFRRARDLLGKLAPYVESNTLYPALPASLKNELWEQLGDFFASAMSGTVQKKIAKKLCRWKRIQDTLMPTSNWPVYLQCLQAYLDQDYDLRDVLRDIDVPTTVLVGLRSDMYPKGGQLRIADYRKNCRVIALDKSGHTPFIDQPLSFLHELKRFVNLETA